MVRKLIIALALSITFIPSTYAYSVGELMHSGYAEMTRGNLDAAIKYFNESVRIDPDNPLCRRYLANALYRAGRFAEALPQLQILMGMGADNIDAILLGQVYISTKTYDKAVEVFSNILEKAPSSQEARDGLVKTFYFMGNRERAVALCNEGIQSSSDQNVKSHFEDMLNKVNNDTLIETPATQSPTERSTPNSRRNEEPKG